VQQYCCTPLLNILRAHPRTFRCACQLARTKLSGSFASIIACKSLRMINIGNTEISGNLEDIKDMVNLTNIMCDFTQVGAAKGALAAA